ncbi:MULTISPECIES: GNAT family N-acetyltransferase [Streptomyces]|uniref:GNAT family N-acetyltransferase n=1 Tax=Streptomyces noboritoensis TaxID=67337 RepID=A0ABV6TTR1_9ACTN|nr:GNAT family N-acetyltransferase [Streptomyces melanogenes]GGP37410.1 N-acetyltransferase [Streptomyces melanogenes]
MFRFETEVDKARRILLHQRLKDTNTERSSALRTLRGSPGEKEVPLHVWALDAKGELAGGLAGRVWASWLHVDLLWVDAAHRGAGVGGELLARAEESARTEHACAWSRLETWDFQAPGFYRKQGYEVVGEVPEYPPGVTEFILTKRL